MEDKKKKNFKSIVQTMLYFINLSKGAKKWFVLKCLNGATMAISWAVLTRYIEYFTKAAIESDMELFKRTSLIYLLIILFMVTTRFVGPFAGARFSMYTTKKLKSNILQSVHRLPISYFDNKHSGDIVTKLTDDVNIIDNFIENDLPTIFGYLPGGILYSLIVLLTMNTTLTLLIIPMTLLSSIFIMKYSFKMRALANKRQQYVSQSNMILRDILENIGVIKIYNLSDHFYKKHDQNLVAAQEEENKIYKRNQVLSVMGYLTRMIPYVAAYLIGVLFIEKGALSVPMLIAYTMLTMALFNNFAHVYIIMAHAAQSTGAMDHIREIEKEGIERKGGEDYSLKTTDDALSFRDVSFSYHKDLNVIKNMNFTINRGEKIALVGESGCGKTTLVKLMQNYYEDYEGVINVNGQSIRQWDIKKLRGNFSYVAQDEYLFSDTIRNNIMYGKIEVEEEQFLRVCEMTGVDEIVSSMEAGYDTFIGERGATLSGGQRQRITLARALLSRNQFIILDEPTSNLDSKSEYYIEKAIQEISSEKTIIIIAHRLSTIINCDQIYVVKDGTVVENGNHKNLIKLKGEYYSLYNQQTIS